MKNILYATDYSKNSIAALKLAHKLATRMGCKLIVMHVFDPPLSLASTVSMTYVKKETRLFVEHRDKLKAFCLDHLGDEWENADLNIVVDENVSATDSILENIVKLDVTMVVVGTKGASKLKEFLLGSTTKALIRKAPSAVLAVPETSEVAQIENIIYASDFENSDIFAIHRLVKIAEPFQATIKLLHIVSGKQGQAKEQMEWFKEILKRKVSYPKIEFHLRSSEDLLFELQTFLKTEKADMLAMLEREKKGIFGKLIHRDKVMQTVSETTVPLLSFSVGAL
ncbi:universal stress protein [Flavobacteriaceae bacterium TP-CH-4]|uniref:Universal stress protein n=1 Tax=Pelagihabitans pacificus TaxID=2696054 RepID=A0A967E6H7_9FLAO|nr:universal stress protein [Pelagihabitans pacificus]NHF59610.1 universal stress protein [Pelagihabitans pacificus]